MKKQISFATVLGLLTVGMTLSTHAAVYGVHTNPDRALIEPVPEASPIIAGALLLLPFGFCALKSLRKPRA